MHGAALRKTGQDRLRHEISWNCILLPCQVPELEVQTIYLYNMFGIWNGNFSSITKSSLGLSVKCTLTSPKRLSRLRLTPHYPWWDSGMVLEKIHKFCMFFPNDWPSIVLTYHDMAIYWYIMMYASKSCLEGWTRMQVSVDPSLRLQFFDCVLGGEVQSW